MLTQSIEPAISLFKQGVDERLTDLDIFLKVQQQDAAKDLDLFRSELAKLQQRNGLTALADKAIGDGDLGSLQELERLANGSDPSTKAAATAEIFRVFDAYSGFGAMRWAETT